jgi:RNA polymerase sigma-70 factor (ECF subfamily)
VQSDIGRLREALGTLPAEQRRAIVLAGVVGLTAREVAEREAIPLGTAKTRIRTALQRLRTALVSEESGE